jgi:hypothetical protein
MPLCETALTLTTHIAAQSFKKLANERLRASLKEDRELPANLRMQIDRLRQLERRSQPRWWPRAEYGSHVRLVPHEPP